MDTREFVLVNGADRARAHVSQKPHHTKKDITDDDQRHLCDVSVSADHAQYPTEPRMLCP